MQVKWPKPKVVDFADTSVMTKSEAHVKCFAKVLVRKNWQSSLKERDVRDERACFQPDPTCCTNAQRIAVYSLGPC